MATTPNLALPLLTSTQAGKEITVNEALALLDTAVALASQVHAFVPTPVAGAVLFGHAAGRASKVKQAGSAARCGTAPTVEVVLSVAVNGVAAGTITFSAGSTSGTVSLTDTALVVGDACTVTAPADVGGLTGLMLTLQMTP